MTSESESGVFEYLSAPFTGDTSERQSVTKTCDQGSSVVTIALTKEVNLAKVLHLQHQKCDKTTVYESVVTSPV